MRIVSGTTDHYVYFVAVDGTDLKTRETGFSSFTVYRSRNGGAPAAMTTPTINETDTTNMPGVYELLLDEDTTLDAGDDTQEMVLHITHAGMAPVTRVVEIYRPETTAGQTLTVASGGADVSSWNGTSLATTNPLPNAAPDAAGGLPISDAGGLDLDSLNNTIQVLANRVGAFTGSGVNTILGFFQALMRSDSTTPSDLGGTYDDATDSLQAIRDHIADGTNLTEAGGTGDHLTAIAWNAAWDAEVQSEVQDAIEVNHLDHLLAVDYDPATKPGIATALLNELVENDGGVSRFTANSLEQSPAAPTVAAIRSEMDANSTQLAAILADTAVIGAAGAGLTAIPWNAAWDAEVESEANDALVALGLDHVVSTAVIGTDVADNSIAARLVSSSVTADWDTYDNTSDSLQAVRDRGDVAWTTGGGGSITDILNLSWVIPTSIDLASTATVRLGIVLTNAVDDLPSTAEITPGTVDIDRKAIGGTSWSSVVSGGACSEQAGMIYYDEVFDGGSGYAEGDSIRVTFKSQKITVSANDYEITDANGVMWQTEIRQTMRGTDGANTTTPPTVAAIRTEIDSNSTQLAAIVADTNEVQTDWADGGRLDLLLDAVLADTGTTLPAVIAALNDVSVADILTTQMTESYNADGAAPTMAQALHLIIAYLMERSVSGTTVTAKKLDGSTTAATFTLDDAGSPTSVTRST